MGWGRRAKYDRGIFMFLFYGIKRRWLNGRKGNKSKTQMGFLHVLSINVTLGVVSSFF